MDIGQISALKDLLSNNSSGSFILKASSVMNCFAECTNSANECRSVVCSKNICAALMLVFNCYWSTPDICKVWFQTYDFFSYAKWQL